MFFRNLQRNSVKRYSATWRFGALCLSVSLLMTTFWNPEGHTTRLVSHFVSGMLLGISLGCFLMPRLCLRSVKSGATETSSAPRP